MAGGVLGTHATRLAAVSTAAYMCGGEESLAPQQASFRFCPRARTHTRQCMGLVGGGGWWGTPSPDSPSSIKRLVLSWLFFFITA